MRSVPEELIESAQMDGASRWKQIFSIYLPLTTPTLFYLVVTDLAFSMMSMSIANVLTAGGPDKSTMTIMLYIFQQFSKNGNYTTANAASVIAFVITMVCTLLSFIWEKKGVNYQ
ncbi:MAG: carbohydrate ABC transporter permease [Lachnospiraceae bacterium]